MPRNIMVGRVIKPMWGDRWVPVTIVNPNETANWHVSPCVAVEDLDMFQGIHMTPVTRPSIATSGNDLPHADKSLAELGLGDVDITQTR